MTNDVVVVIGTGGIGLAIARRQGFGKTVLLADFNEKTLQVGAEQLKEASYSVATHVVDVSSRASVRSLVEAAAALGGVTQVIKTAGLPPNMAPVAVQGFSRTTSTCPTRCSSALIRWLTAEGVTCSLAAAASKDPCPITAAPAVGS